MKQHAPATERNRAAILAVLQRCLPSRGTVLEIAAGTGQHAVYFAAQLQNLIWLPSDVDPDRLASITAWRREHPESMLREPLRVDVTGEKWGAPLTAITPLISAVVCINMIHIAPWSATEGLFAGAAAFLPADGVLFLYGPFRREGRHTAPSNASFDDWLKSENPEWGVRDLDEVAALAAEAGFVMQDVVDMPANNLSVIFRRIA